MRILIVEDSETSRIILAGLLDKLGHETVSAETGESAWQIMQENDAPQIILLDWMMPGMSGLELCRKIRDNKQELPPYIIMVTGKSDKADLITALEAGANDYLTKPFDAGELSARVESARRTVELQQRLSQKIEELNKALSEIETLRGIIPICSNCKKIRSDKNSWENMETYIQNHSEAKFSHGICPDCVKILYPEIYDQLSEQQKR